MKTPRARTFFVVLTMTACLTIVLPAASRPPVRAEHGMVVTTHYLATDVGVEILNKGGNAVDAAVAVGFALAAVHPSAGNIGGGGFMVIHDAKGNEDATIDYREMAPASARHDMYLDDEGEVVEDLSTVGHLASGVPGSVAGLHLAWKTCGKLAWKELLAPAIRLARRGFAVSHVFEKSLEDAHKLLERFPESNRIFLRNGNYYREGEIFRQPELADTLQAIADHGPDAFYKGVIAKKIAQHMSKHGGNIRLEDLAAYEAKVRTPVRGEYRGYTVVSMGPPSSGGVILVEMLNMLEPYPIQRLGFGSSRTVHLMTEVMRRAFADRAEFLGDPDFGEVPVAGLIDKSYARGWTPRIEGDWASPSDYVGHGDPLPYESSETTHYSVVDGDGSAVSVTTTINGGYGSGVTIEGAGFLMNNEMDDFSSKPGVPNMYGLIQGEANSIAPRKRPLSAMTPTIVLKDGKVFLVTGSPGGPTIINTVLQTIVNVVDHGMDVQEAVDAPRFHHQWLPDRIVAERGALVKDVELALLAKGHEIAYRNAIGDAQCILIDPETGLRLGGADPRRGDSKAAGN